MKILPVLLIFSVSVYTLSADAGDYQGAEAILKRVEEQASKVEPPSPKEDPVAQLRADLKSYGERAGTFSAEQAARDWLGLFERAVKLPDAPFQTRYGSGVPARLAKVFECLPPPPAWDALSAQIAARPEAGGATTDLSGPVLRILSGILQNRPEDVRRDIEALQQRVAGLEDSEASGRSYQMDALLEAFYALSRDKAGTIKDFETRLMLASPASTGGPIGARQRFMRQRSLDVPDLVTLVGETRAEELLRKVFAVPLPAVEIRGEKTQALARKVAADMDAQLKFAPWSLVSSLDATALYEVLAKRFPANSENESNRQQATAYYLLGLIAQDRSEDAAKTALALAADASSSRTTEYSSGILPSEALNELAGKGYAKGVFQFLDRLLAAHADLPYWNDYINAAVVAGETDAMLARTKAASERDDLLPAPRKALKTAYLAALIAADHVSEALPGLRELAAAKPSGDNGNNQRPDISLASKLAGIGWLLHDKALLDEQLDTILARIQPRPGVVSDLSVLANENVLELFLNAGRGPELEQALATGLLTNERIAKQRRAKINAAPRLDPRFAFYEGQSDNLLVGPLVTLVDLYARAGRYVDVMTLLDHGNAWGVDDLGKLMSLSRPWSSPDFEPQIARALQKTGHPDAALHLINAFLERRGGRDSAYALLLELLPADQAETRLNELFRSDQFEERPLIWRAVLQLKQSRLDEAEKSARQAIGIDPSDGEQGEGDRMRAYAVLGDILEHKGDADKAALMRRAVKAIRLSEQADRFHSAGLLTRAVAMYEEALGYFADAYCIQSRLAIQLTALGKFDEALAHYERAYELMPESFGRMESHCFGCEHAFKGQRAQNLAERVFQRLAEQQPANPRVHYLLGYLRSEQDRREEAAQQFREAVRLDPDYINAWKQLGQNSDDPADRDQAALNLLRLDPRQKHDSATLSEVNDLRALWQAVAIAQKSAISPVKGIYPLAASKLALEENQRSNPRHLPPNGDGQENAFEEMYRSERPVLTPPSAVLQNRVIVQALALLSRNDVAGYQGAIEE